MEITVWGSRGSAPVSSADSAIFGGNTTCVEVISASGARIILDAGTGIRNLGETIAKDSSGGKCSILISHTHWDHIQGLPFFHPLYNPGWQIDIYGAGQQMGIMQSVRHMLDGIHFPLRLKDIPGHLCFHDLKPGDTFYIDDVKIETCPTNHPGGAIAYKLTADGWSFAFTGDHEHNGEAVICERLEQFISNVDVLLADGQYFAEEAPAFNGWGHTYLETWPPLANRLGIKRLFLTHHDPRRNDRQLEDVKKRLRAQFPHADMAFDGMQIKHHNMATNHSPAHSTHSYNIAWVYQVNKNISQYGDVDMINDAILDEARATTQAEAGTLYLVENNDLVFAYTQNDKLFPGSAGIKQLYHNLRIPISTNSIAGYVAVSRKTLQLDNVRNLPENLPFSFNPAWDKQSGYRTVSMLVLPLIRDEKLLGVLQLINSLDYQGRPVPFSHEMRGRIEYLNEVAVNALERGIMARELIVRMLRLSKMRDPAETSGHVHRVGSMAAELYHFWAEQRKIDDTDIKRMKDRIRLAAMLHDIGKVGIADNILKKPGKLDPDERAAMEQHSYMGGRVFNHVTWEVDDMARQIALHHHQKWNGSGYTGHESYPQLAGEQIPLEARITAVADVYDALRSKRCYKESMPLEKAVAIISNDAGSHFDPQLVDIFLKHVDVMEAILERFPNEPEEEQV